MDDQMVSSAHGMHMVDDCLVVPVHGDVDDAYALKLQQDILKNVKLNGARAVFIDVSTVRILDAFTFSIFKDTAQMISMLGAEVAFVGFQAGVASALVDLDVDFGDIQTAVTMQDGFELLRSKASVFTTTDSIEDRADTSPDIDVDENESTEP